MLVRSDVAAKPWCVRACMDWRTNGMVLIVADRSGLWFPARVLVLILKSVHTTYTSSDIPIPWTSGYPSRDSLV